MIRQPAPSSLRARLLPAVAALGCLVLLAMPASAGPARGLDAVPEQCLYGAARESYLPVDALRLILMVEQGAVGVCSQNENGTRDCGPGQINSIWFPKIAAGRVDPGVIERAITHDACYNIRITAWILRSELDAVGWGSFWTAVGNYHSRTPHLHQRYLGRIVDAARTLAARGQRDRARSTIMATPPAAEQPLPMQK